MTPAADRPEDTKDEEETFYDAAEVPIDLPAGPRNVTNGIHFSDLVNEGTVFDTDHVPSRAEREMRDDAQDADEVEAEAGWWTSDQLASHLKQNDAIKPNTGLPDDADIDKCVFDLKKSQMQVIYQNESGEALVWKVIQYPGHGKSVTENSSIEYDLEAYAEECDEPFDSSKLMNRLYHSRLNSDPVLPGLFICLTSMRVGEKAQFIIHSSLGFGELGCPPRIPPATDIFYDITVVKLIEEGTINEFIYKSVEEQQGLPFQQLLDMANSERQSGNAYFVDGKMKQAGIRYKRAIKILEDRNLKSREEEKAVQEILIKLYCNTANTSVHLNRPYVAMHYCNKALKLDKDSVKALYQYGKAKIDTGDYDEAVRYLLRARQIKPSNTMIAQQLARLNQRLQDDRMTSHELEMKMAQMFTDK